MTENLESNSATTLKKLVELLQKEYPKVFDHKRQSFPYVHLPAFEEEIKSHDVLVKYDALSILEIIRKQNSIYSITLQRKDNQAYLKAENLGGFYLASDNAKARWVRWVFK